MFEFEHFVYFLVAEGGVLDVYFACPEGQLDVLEAGDELPEVAPEDGLQHLFEHVIIMSIL